MFDSSKDLDIPNPLLQPIYHLQELDQHWLVLLQQH
jgi:hypothetical protein